MMIQCSDVFGRGRFRALCVSLMLMLLMVGADAFAITVGFGDDGRIDIDTTLGYEAAWRMDDMDPALATTGNAEFDKGDLINNKFTVGMDVDAQWKNYGLFLRGRGLYDFIYVDDKFHPKTEDRHGKDVELLDAFVYADLEVGESPLTIRVGRQSVSWGEGLFIGNSISTAQSPLDLTKSNSPGAELKDLFLPTGQAYAQITTPDSKFTLAGYYKWEWEATRLDEFGNFFSTNDALDEAGTFFGPFPRVNDIDADDGGEYGFALRYLANGGTEFGLFHINYHETMPLAQLFFNPGPSGYFLEYQEDVKLYGASVSGVIGPTNVSAEASYRPNLKVGIVGPIPGVPAYDEAEVLQVQVSAIHVFGDIGIADNATLTAEWGYNQVLDFDKDELAADKWATGGAFKLTMDYYNVVNDLDITVPIVLKYNPKGTSAAALSGFTEDAHSVSFGADLTYSGVYKLGIKYTAFLGDAADNNNADRDCLGLTLKYTF